MRLNTREGESPFIGAGRVNDCGCGIGILKRTCLEVFEMGYTVYWAIGSKVRVLDWLYVKGLPMLYPWRL